MPEYNSTFSQKHPSTDPPQPGTKKKARTKGAIGRWLNKMAKANEKAFGPKGPCCH